jgi:hypothetical protein
LYKHHDGNIVPGGCLGGGSEAPTSEQKLEKTWQISISYFALGADVLQSLSSFSIACPTASWETIHTFVPIIAT